MSSGTKVVIRIRYEKSENVEFIPMELAATTIHLKEENKSFRYDSIIQPEHDQVEMYHFTTEDMIYNYCMGFNCTIMCYGMSGTGKTFTMVGPDDCIEAIVNGTAADNPDIQKLYGIIPRVAIQLYEFIESARDQMTNTIRVQYIEIYNEKTYDLIADGESTEKKLREIPKRGFQVVGAADPVCSNMEDIFDMLARGNSRRKVAGTGLNSRSSRSHTIFILDMETLKPDGSCTSRRLNLVDLAGSERISKTGATGDTLKEAQKINLSLSTLGLVISKLVKNDSNIPFRDSSLTKLLKESLGGNAKTCLICTMSRRADHLEETVQTLEFATRARAIKSKAKVNVHRSMEELERIVKGLQEQIDKLAGKLEEQGKQPAQILEDFMKSGHDKHVKVDTGVDDKYVDHEAEEEANLLLIEMRAKIDSVKESYEFELEKLKEEMENSKDPANHQLVQQLVENLNDKQGTLMEHQDVKQALTHENTQILYQIKQMQDQFNISEIKQNIEIKNNEYHELSQENKIINESITSMEGEIQMIIDKLESLKMESETVGEKSMETRGLVKKSKKELEQLKETLDDYENDLGAQKQDYEDNLATFNSLSNKINNLENNHIDKTNELNKILEKIQEIEKNSTQLTNENKKYKIMIDELKIEYNNRIIELKSEFENICSDSYEKNIQLQNITKNIEFYSNSDNSKDYHEYLLNNKKSELERNKEYLVKTSMKTSTVEKIYENKEKEYKIKINTQINTMEKEKNDEINQLISDFEKVKKHDQEKIQEAHKKVEELKSEHVKIEEILTCAKRETEIKLLDLKNKINVYNKESEHKKELNKEKKIKISTTEDKYLNNYNKERDRLNKELEVTTIQFHKLNSEINEMESNISKTQIDKNVLKKEHDSEEKLLKSKEMKLAEIKKEYDKMIIKVEEQRAKKLEINNLRELNGINADEIIQINIQGRQSDINSIKGERRNTFRKASFMGMPLGGLNSNDSYSDHNRGSIRDRLSSITDSTNPKALANNRESLSRKSLYANELNKLQAKGMYGDKMANLVKSMTGNYHSNSKFSLSEMDEHSEGSSNRE